MNAKRARSTELNVEQVSAVDILAGYKTYIVAAAVAAATVARFLELIDNEQYAMIMGLLGAGGLTAFKMAQNRIEKKVDNTI